MATKKSKPTKKANPVGRPTKYKKEYCHMLIGFMAAGKSFSAFAGKICVAIDTIHEWAKIHKEFSDAKKEGFAQSLLEWEDMGLEMAKNGNAAVWIFNMKNRHNWTDKVETDSTVRVEPLIIEDDEGVVSTYGVQ